MNIALIANPMAGGGRCRRHFSSAISALRYRGITHKLYPTNHHGQAREVAAGLNLQKYDGVVAMGGDGTNFEVLNGLLRNPGAHNLPPLGLFPAGRGNSFARDLGIDSIDQAIQAIDRHQTRPVDVGRLTQAQSNHYFVNMVGLGFVTDVAATALRFRCLGALSYVIGVFIQTIKRPIYHLKIEIDGQRWSAPNLFLECCNSRYTAGNMLMAPDARIDDGYLDIVICAPLTRRNLLATFPKIFNGAHGQNPNIAFMRARQVTLTTVPSKTLLPDGEILGATPTHIQIYPQRVSYFA